MNPTPDKNSVHGTTGGRMPNPEFKQDSEKNKSEAEAAFGQGIPDQIPESRGDAADQAELEIENSIRGEIERARRANPSDYIKKGQPEK
jgi:hypothetical protein